MPNSVHIDPMTRGTNDGPNYKNILRLGPDPLFQLIELAGMVGSTIRRDDFNVPATVRNQFSGFLHRGWVPTLVQYLRFPRSKRGNQELHEGSLGFGGGVKGGVAQSPRWTRSD